MRPIFQTTEPGVARRFTGEYRHSRWVSSKEAKVRFMKRHPKMERHELARLMKARGLYAASTAIVDIATSIMRFREEGP